ncbi:MAG: hypothetical protein ABIK28_22615 [Planctomycetota bacterium]
MIRFELISKGFFVISAMCLVLCFTGCGGGGSSGSSATVAGSNYGGDSTFYLEDALFGRPRLDAGGALIGVINPASIVETDPITGLELDGYPQPLFPEESLSTLYSLNLGDTTTSTYKVKILPRNAAIVLDFTLPVDPESLNLKDLHLTATSPISLVTESGTTVKCEVWWGGWIGLGEDKVILNPIAGGTLGFPPSPLIFDQDGNPKGSKKGFLQLSIYSGGTGPNNIKSTDAKVLSARSDLYGTPLKPIGFNPGNAKLDFMEYGDVSFNGFLPDVSAPRIIRQVRHPDDINKQNVVGEGSTTLMIYDGDDTTFFNVTANDGKGEWAGGLLTLRPGTAQEEKLEVDYNEIVGGTDIIHLIPKAFDTAPPFPGDAYNLIRAEFYEPIPGVDLTLAVDPVNHPKDPNDPEDEKNSDLFNFAIHEEWQEGPDGWFWGSPKVGYDPGPYGLAPVDPRWRISFRFSEPMSLESFRPYETFYVCNSTVNIEEPGFDQMLPGRVTSSSENRVISFEPVAFDQYQDEEAVVSGPDQVGKNKLIGFGGKPKSLRLTIRVMPPAEQVNDFYKSLGPDTASWPPEVIADLDSLGVFGVFDLGGQPMGLPAAFLDKGSINSVLNSQSPGRGAFVPTIDLKYEFDTTELVPEKDYPETGVFVHRFMGLPETSVGGWPVQITGIVFNDHKGMIYGPNIADASVGLNGFLSGRAVEFIEQVFDDYNYPAPSSPTYFDPINKLPFGASTPITASFGCRFQHVYRRGDVSPDVESFKNTQLDLVGMSWAPIGGWVTNTTIEEISIAISYTSVVPDTNQSGGIPSNGESGLGRLFKNNILPSTDPAVPDQIMVVGSENRGVAYNLDWRNLYGPKNQGLNFNNYLPWPDFHTSFPFDSMNSLLVEYRMDPNISTGLSQVNGFAFHAGIISSMLPRFRVYIRGDDPLTPGGNNNVWAASNPANYYIATGPLASPGNYGDNSRYLMIFNYVKRKSIVESPFLGKVVDANHFVYILDPIIEPSLEEIPDGTELDVQFRTAPNPESVASYSPWKYPEEVKAFFNVPPFDSHSYIRFKAIFEANVDEGVLPAIDTIAIPYLLKAK